MLLDKEDEGFDKSELNPYSNQVDLELSSHPDIEVVKEALIDRQEGSQWREPRNAHRKVALNKELLLRRITYLQHLLVVHTGRAEFSRDFILEWVNKVCVEDYGVSVEKVELLSHHSFMVIVRSFDEQQRVLGASPMYMDGLMVVALPWHATTSSYKMTKNSYSVWVDLLSVNPIYSGNLHKLHVEVGGKIHLLLVLC